MYVLVEVVMKALICLFLFACLPVAAQDYLVWSKRYDYNVHDVRYSPDEKTVAVAHGDSISILSANDGHTIRTIGTRPERFQIEQVIFAPDGNSIIVRYEEKKLIDEWNVNDGSLRESYLKDYQNVPTIKWLNYIDISPDGKYLTATYFSGIDKPTLLVVTELKTGKELVHKEGKYYSGVKFSHDGNHLVAINSSLDPILNPTVEIYNTSDFSVWSGQLGANSSDKMAINYIDFSYNDSLLALVTVGGGAAYYAIWLLDMKTKNISKPISTWDAPDVRRMKFYSDNQHILTGGGGGLNLRGYSTILPLSPYVFEDSFAIGGGFRGIDCSIKNGNIVSSSGITVVLYNNKWLLPNGVEENTVQSDSTVYPNPTNGQVTIKVGFPSIIPINYSIVDITGKQYPLLANTTWEGNTYQLSFNAGALPRGKYFSRLQAGATIRTFTFIKE